MNKFVIIGIGRCGSQLVMHTLNNREDCVCGSEICDPNLIGQHIADRDGAEYAEEWYAEHNTEGVKAVGFRLLRWQAQHAPMIRVWGHLQRSRTRIVHLVRRNLVKQIVSLNIASENKEWSFGPEHEPPRRVMQTQYDPKSWLQWLQKYEKYTQEMSDLYSANPYLRWYYEDISDNFDDSMRAIHGFLGLDYSPTPPPLRKQNRVPLSEHISNMDELRKFLDSTHYRWMLDDPE